MDNRLLIYTALNEFYKEGNKLLHIGNLQEASEFFEKFAGVSTEELEEFLLEHGAQSHMNIQETSRLLDEVLEKNV